VDGRLIGGTKVCEVDSSGLEEGRMAGCSRGGNVLYLTKQAKYFLTRTAIFILPFIDFFRQYRLSCCRENI
jgi:hypothetical protein